MKITTRHLLGVLLLTLSLGLAVFEGRGLPTGRALVATPIGGDARIAQAFARHESNVPIALHGRVKRLLPDDTRGRPHQRFLLLLASGHTLLIAHNTELAPRVEGLSVGAEVSLQGEYEWNDKGGVVHWTHHDPDGRRQGGWIEFAGRRYR